MSEKERVSLAIEPELLARFDAMIARSGGNRSEAVRGMIRSRVIEQEWASSSSGDAVATVTLVYDHSKRELSDRMLDVGHHNHQAIVASMHIHLDHDHCLEMIALRGKPQQLRAIADQLIGMKGVKHGQIVVSGSAA
jgi:CopG family nickel-responsive transcriptional regulator